MTTAALVSVVLILLILGGLPIFLASGVAGMAGLFMVRGSAALSLAPTSFFGQLSSFEMIALPLFILMGHTLAATPIGRDLFLAASRWLGWLRGGLAIASVGACTAFGAVSGVSIAGVASVGALAVPEVIERGYSRSLAAGALVTAGALAMLIGFVERLQQNAGDALAVEFYDSGTLVKADEQVSALRAGTIDFMFHTSSYITRSFEILGITGLPSLVEDLYEHGERIAMETPLWELINEELAKSNLFMLSAGGGIFEPEYV